MGFLVLEERRAQAIAMSGHGFGLGYEARDGLFVM
jgi:hypothetical protein